MRRYLTHARYSSSAARGRSTLQGAALSEEVPVYATRVVGLAKVLSTPCRTGISPEGSASTGILTWVLRACLAVTRPTYGGLYAAMAVLPVSAPRPRGKVGVLGLDGRHGVSTRLWSRI